MRYFRLFVIIILCSFYIILFGQESEKKEEGKPTGTIVKAVSTNTVPNDEPEPILEVVDNLNTLEKFQDLNHSGAFFYSIHISVPPGNLGVEPNINLVYNSHSKNGLLGMGWSIDGISSIERVEKTKAQDGIFAGVNLDAKDKFALDGNRLIAIEGEYGKNNTSYRTEIESWSKIVSKGYAENGPISFTVWTKNKLLLEYGGTVDSRISVKNKGVIHTWALNKVRDENGNYIKFIYNKDVSNGAFYIKEIQYTGNRKTGLLPNRHVKFIYENRPDHYINFLNGATIKTVLRLKEIQTYIDAALVLNYGLKYENNSSSKRSRLISIKKSSASGDSLPELTFQWGKEGEVGKTWIKAVSQSGLHGMGAYMGFVDINGDGKADYVAKNNDGNIHWNLRTANGWGPPQTQGGLHGMGSQCWFVDINGDGKADYVAKTADDSIHWNFSIGDGTTNNQWGPNESQKGMHGLGVQRWLVDINGDGLPDYVAKNNDGNIHWNLRTANGWGPSQTQGGLHGMGSQCWFVDINGDGKADYVAKTADDSIHWNLSIGDGTTNNQWGPNESQKGMHGLGVQRWLVDINGDGLPDYVAKNPDGNIHWNLRTANGWGPPHTQDGLHGMCDQCWFVDINGDGKADYVTKTVDDFIHWNLSIGDGTTNNHWGPNESQTGMHGLGAQRWLVDINGDGLPDYVAKNPDGAIHWNLRSKNPLDLLQKVKDTFGATIKINYESGPNDSLYKKDNQSVYPVIDIPAPHWIIESIDNSDGLGGQCHYSFKYTGEKYDFCRRRHLTYSTIYYIDEGSRKVKEVRYHQHFPLVGRPYRITEKLKNDTTINRHDLHWSAINNEKAKNWIVLPEKEFFQNHEIDGEVFSSHTIDREYDAFGNEIRSSTLYNNGFAIIQERTYSNNTDKWHIGLLTKDKIIYRNPKYFEQNKTKIFAYDEFGRLSKKTLKAEFELKLEFSYKYDKAGNIIEEKVKDLGCASDERITLTQYDKFGSPMLRINPMKQKETFNYDHRWGKIVHYKNVNSVLSEFEYDGFGRIIKSQKSGQGKFLWAYKFIEKDSTFEISTERSGAGKEIHLFNCLGKLIQKRRVGLSGQIIITDLVYDNRRRLKKMSVPHFQNKKPYWITYEYDDIDRKISTRFPDGRFVNVKHIGLKKTETDTLGNKNTFIYNIMGKITEIIDAEGYSVLYDYDSIGNLITIRGVDNSITKCSYDLNGNLIMLSDPDRGLWRFKYNAFGELIWQKDPKGRDMIRKHDSLGRPTRQIEFDREIIYKYDSSLNGVGKISEISDSTGYKEKFTYDNFSRLASKEIFIEGIPYAVKWEYDNIGRTKFITYPNEQMVIENVYNKYGLLSELIDTVSKKTLWKAISLDASDRILSEEYGNNVSTFNTFNPLTEKIEAIKCVTNENNTLMHLSYKYDLDGKVMQREDKVDETVETFSYDSLKRLVSSSLPEIYSNDRKEQFITYTYGPNGNLLLKSNFGKYKYQSEVGSPGPHAVTDILGSFEEKFQERIPSHDLDYDANGNMIKGLGRKIEYTSTNMPKKIESQIHSLKEDKSKNDVMQVQLHYSSDDKRILKISKTIQLENENTEQNAKISKTTYFPGYYEKTERNGFIFHKVFLYGGNRIIGVSITKEKKSADKREKREKNNVFYYHADSLGSIVGVTNSAGNLIVKRVFTPFGEEIDINKYRTNRSNNNEYHFLFTTGFSGHEYDREIGLLNMKNRIYDPQLSRFLTPDPLMEIPMDSQGFNQYSYVNNSPLNFIDPAGLAPKKRRYTLYFGAGLGGGLALTGRVSRGGWAEFDFNKADEGTISIRTGVYVTGGGGSLAGGSLGAGLEFGMVAGGVEDFEGFTFSKGGSLGNGVSLSGDVTVSMNDNHTFGFSIAPEVSISFGIGVYTRIDYTSIDYGTEYTFNFDFIKELYNIYREYENRAEEQRKKEIESKQIEHIIREIMESPSKGYIDKTPMGRDYSNAV